MKLSDQPLASRFHCRGRKLLSGVSRKWNLLAGGWSLSFMHSHGSGQFLTPAWTGPDPTGTINTTSSTPAQVTIRPDILRNPNLPKDRRTMARYFDTGAFGPPQKGAYGTSAPGVIKGPGYVSNSAGLYKGFEITERVRLRWEATFGNVFNHPAWNNPGTNINSPLTLGVITWAGGERSGQTGLRLEW